MKSTYHFSDPKFSGKIRQLNALPTFHFYLKLFYQHNSKLVIPLLMVIKAVAKNSKLKNSLYLLTVCIFNLYFSLTYVHLFTLDNLLTILIKDGISSTMEKMFCGVSFTPSTKLKLLLNIFSYLSKNGKQVNTLHWIKRFSQLARMVFIEMWKKETHVGKNIVFYPFAGQFCSRIIKAGVVPIFLKIFSRWEKYDGKTRLKICNDTIITLQHICSTSKLSEPIMSETRVHSLILNLPTYFFVEQGRSAIRRENGFTPLYKFCLSCPEDKVYDRLLTKVCAIINVCLQKKELPLCSPMSPAHFPLPVDVKKGE